MRIITRTGYGNQLQSCLVQNINHILQPYTTLNEALLDPLIVPFKPAVATAAKETYQPYDSELDTKKYATNFLVIGNLGHRSTIVGNIAVNVPVPHASTDSGLYSWIPFLAKEVHPTNNDISIAERENYRLRVIMQIDGKLYAVYYAKRMDTSATSSDLLLTTVDGNNESTALFSPSIANLRPTQPPVGTTSSGSYLTTGSVTTVPFTADEVAEIIAACTLIFGNPALATITEMGIVQGVDKEIETVYPATGTQTPVAVAPDTYFELAGAQIATFMCVEYPLSSLNNGFSFTVDLGVTEPLFGAEIS